MNFDYDHARFKKIQSQHEQSMREAKLVAFVLALCVAAAIFWGSQ